ncbi:MAG: hypothetical protein LBM13_03500 [Candidatus Ancillula sp.]|jgi:hypothetical protein|nr:hypothetical protein [Candidatus Ancillula sp.]
MMDEEGSGQKTVSAGMEVNNAGRPKQPQQSQPRVVPTTAKVSQPKYSTQPNKS